MKTVVKGRNQVKVANLSELPLEIGKKVIVNGKAIALFKLANGKVRATANSCPHKQGPLAEGIVSGDHVFCPLHDRKISLEDGLVQKPDFGCVKTYEVTVMGDDIYIRLRD